MRVKQWLDGIQQELDLSWAVLGEVYGRYEKEQLNILAPNLRRIRSSLDDLNTFSREVNYVPEKVAFEAANSDLLKLLIGPLYGDDPGIGIRELIQNAVDAVHEFNDLVSQRPALESVVRNKINTDVRVEINCDKEYFPQNVTIIDRGVGMNLDIIKNYYLKAGASFRNSDAWKKEHEDSDGKSRVLRTGRFGIGALASFLMGDEIEVTTRHAEETSGKGFFFKAKLDEEAISISRKECCVGTKVIVNIPKTSQKNIKVELLNGKYSRRDFNKDLAFNLDTREALGSYLLANPKVEIVVNPNEIKGKIKTTIPNVDTPWERPWRSFDTSEYEKIFWTFSGDIYLACNGISINPGSSGSLRYNDLRLFGLDDKTPEYIAEPYVSIFDKNGRLPLNLQRTSLSSTNVSFGEDLWGSVANDLIAYALVTVPDIQGGDKLFDISWFSGEYIGFVRYGGDSTFSNNFRWTTHREGVSLTDPFVLQSINCTVIFNCYQSLSTSGNLYSFYDKDFISNLPTNVGMLCIGSFRPDVLNDLKSCVRSLLETVSILSYPRQEGNRILLKGRRAIISKVVLDSVLNSDGLGKQLRNIINKAELELELAEWKIFKVGECPVDSVIDLLNIFESLPSKSQPIAFSEDYIEDYKSDLICNDIIASRWVELFKNKVIPYEVNERTRLFANVFEILQPYINMHKEEIEIESGNTSNFKPIRYKK